jgi:hypothetical protein
MKETSLSAKSLYSCLLIQLNQAFRVRLDTFSITHGHFPTIKLPPFHAILQEGFDRLLKLVPKEEFTFIVKGEELKITLFEAVLISPINSERLKIDLINRFFNAESDEIETKHLSTLLNFIRNR